LHWVVFAAIWVQWLFNEPMKRTIEAMKTGNTPAGNDMTMAWIYVGF
jgi:cytochrome b561